MNETYASQLDRSWSHAQRIGSFDHQPDFGYLSYFHRTAYALRLHEHNKAFKSEMCPIPLIVKKN